MALRRPAARRVQPRRAPPVDAALYALDSGNPDRLALPSWGDVAVNIDHHHDNPRYGELAFVRGAASSTSELVCDVALRALGLHLPQAAAALYAGISFDTGHFHHDSTAPSTFRTAAWLVELGVDVTGMYALLYESRSQASLRLWARAVAGATALAGGRALLAGVTTDDFALTGAGPRRPTASSTACAASTASRWPPSSRNRRAARACASACARRRSTSAPSPPCRVGAATSSLRGSRATTVLRR